MFKVEPTPHGDFIRSWGPFDRGESAYFLSTNRNKRSIALDFRHPDSRDLLQEWALRCDVVVENFKPGTAEAMGLHIHSLDEALNAAQVRASGMVETVLHPALGELELRRRLRGAPSVPLSRSV